MIERIEELRTLYLLSPDELDEVFAHIDHLTAELSRRQQQVETLRAAARQVLEENAYEPDLTCLADALAATSETGGEGRGR